MKVDLKPMLAMHREDFLKMTHQEPQMEDTEDSTWVGEMIFDIISDNDYVGYVSYSSWGDGACCLSSLYINEPFRHKGIATAVIKKLIYKLSKEYTLLYGFVHKDNKVAIELYHKLGFKYFSHTMEYNLEYPNEKAVFRDDACSFYEFGLKLK